MIVPDFEKIEFDLVIKKSRNKNAPQEPYYRREEKPPEYKVIELVEVTVEMGKHTPCLFPCHTSGFQVADP